MAEIAPAAVFFFLGMRLDFAAEKFGEPFNGSRAGIRLPILRYFAPDAVSTGDLSPAMEFVFADGPVEHRNRIEVELLAHGERIERALEARSALDQLFH